MKQLKIEYPDSYVIDAFETLAGIRFADPYRWLEDDNEEVREWQRAQARLASAHVRDWPAFERLQKLVERFSTGRPERGGGMPRYAGGKWFRARVVHGASQAQAVVSDEPLGEGRVLFDPLQEDPAHPPFLSWLSPSPDGRMLAIGICTDASEKNTLRIIDVASGRPLSDPPSQRLMDNWTGGAHWLPDSSGFFFLGLIDEKAGVNKQVFRHRRDPEPDTQVVDVPWVGGEKDYRMITVANDGRHAVAIERLFNPIPVAFANLEEDAPTWKPFVTSLDGTVAGHLVGRQFIAITDVGAPRGRLVAIDLDVPNPNDPAQWRELVPESDAVLRTVTMVRDVLYLTEFLDTYARIRIVDTGGKMLGLVPLPDRGAVSELQFPMMNLVPRGSPDRFLFAFSSLTTSPGLYSNAPGENHLEVLQAPQVHLKHAIVEDHWARSTDGTRIPYHVVRRRDVDEHRAQPTLIYVYGGFNFPLIPQFPGPMAAFVAAGGVYVHAHLRGGGELGRGWWEAGRFQNKQNTFDDLYAIAEDLIRKGRCTASSLAVCGGSNGGMVVGVAITQRPELWAAAVPRVPRMDLIGSCRNAYGRWSVMSDRTENPDDPQEARRLVTFSPYQLIREGTSYPAVFIEAGESDPRCPAHDARRFAARLQHASAGDAPILLHVWEREGHGLATDRQVAVLQSSEWLAFVFEQLGMDDWSDVD